MIYYLYLNYGYTTESLIDKSEDLEKLKKLKKQESKYYPDDELEIVCFSDSGEIQCA